MRVVFMGTPEFSVPTLKALAKEHQVVAVYTQPDRPVGRGLEMRPSGVKRAALELGLAIVQPEKLSAPGEFEKLKELRPDAIVVVAYGQILKRNVIDLAPLGCINIHSSLLPRWRGAAPINWAVLSGDRETGVTTMRIVEKLDAGDILLQKTTTISAQDTAQQVHDRLASMGADLILPTLKGLSEGTLVPKAQDESQVTYAAKLTKEMEFFSPRKTARELDLQFRALNPWPGTSFFLETGERLKVQEAVLRSDVTSVEGELFEKFGMLLLGTSQGSLELKKLQWEGKKPVDASSFINGLKGKGIQLPLRWKGSSP